MRKFIGRIPAGLCVILLTAAYAYSQAESKSPVVSCPDKNNLTDKEIKKILKAHNSERAKLKTPDLVWDCKLANLAQEWATQGITDHSQNTEAFGENIYYTSLSTVPAAHGVKRWIAEKKHYDPATAVCADGKVCGHYTQVITKFSLRVGCGINRTMQGKWKALLVCNYDPPGN